MAIIATAATTMISFSHDTAAIILGTYQLKNKATCAIDPPPYGLRLGGFFSGNNSNNWTFDFEHAGAKVYLQTVGNGTGNVDIYIFGTVFGGKDTGPGYKVGTTGFWELDLTYTDGVSIGLGNEGKSLKVDPLHSGIGAGAGTIKYIGDKADSTGVIHNLVDTGVLTIDLLNKSGDKGFSFCYGVFAGITTSSGCGPQTVSGESRVKGSEFIPGGKEKTNSR